MTAAIPVHVALVDDTGEISAQDLAACAGAINQDIAQNVGPVWQLAATVGAYPAAPANTWAVRVQKQLDQPGALGVHSDEQNQPVAYVELTDSWTVTASHEIDEMLADPFGNRMHGGQLPAGLESQFAQFGLAAASDEVSYLLEVCDPPEATSYQIGAVSVSDFLLPSWYDAADPSGSFSHAGACTAPRQVAAGGYVSFSNAAGEWFQVFNEGGLQVHDIGHFDRAAFGSLREFTDHHARQHRAGQTS